jgi:uncharacterized membrane protein YqjE
VENNAAAVPGPRPGGVYRQPDDDRSPGPGDDFDDRDRDDAPRQPRGAGSRLYSVASSLLRVHYEIAEREAAADQQRLLRGAIFFALAFFLLLLMLLVGQALLVWVLRDAGLPTLAALGITAGADAVLGVFFYLLGRSSWKAPVLPQTRALFRRTMTALLSP